jgi:hypothetical protein
MFSFNAKAPTKLTSTELPTKPSSIKASDFDLSLARLKAASSIKSKAFGGMPTNSVPVVPIQVQQASQPQPQQQQQQQQQQATAAGGTLEQSRGAISGTNAAPPGDVLVAIIVWNGDVSSGTEELMFQLSTHPRVGGTLKVVMSSLHRARNHGVQYILEVRWHRSLGHCSWVQLASEALRLRRLRTRLNVGGSVAHAKWLVFAYSVCTSRFRCDVGGFRQASQCQQARDLGHHGAALCAVPATLHSTASDARRAAEHVVLADAVAQAWQRACASVWHWLRVHAGGNVGIRQYGQALWRQGMALCGTDRLHTAMLKHGCMCGWGESSANGFGWRARSTARTCISRTRTLRSARPCSKPMLQYVWHCRVA